MFLSTESGAQYHWIFITNKLDYNNKVGTSPRLVMEKNLQKSCKEIGGLPVPSRNLTWKPRLLHWISMMMLTTARGE